MNTKEVPNKCGMGWSIKDHTNVREVRRNISEGEAATLACLGSTEVDWFSWGTENKTRSTEENITAEKMPRSKPAYGHRFAGTIRKSLSWKRRIKS